METGKMAVDGLNDNRESPPEDVQQQERILRRRERVQNRLEIKRAPPREKTPTPPPPASVVDVQVQRSRRSLFRALADGNELVSNVEKASTARSRNNRHDAAQTRARIGRSIVEDAAACEESFADISAKWVPILKENMAAEDLHAAVGEQNARCASIIEGKNKIIDTLSKEIQKTEKAYSENLRKQEKDVELLISRMESQYKILRTMFQEELRALEFAVFEEHGDILSTCEEAFDSSLAAVREEDDRGLAVRMADREKLREEVMAAQRSEYHDLRVLKEELDQEVHATRLHVQETKAKCLLREEQLEYTCYLLKRREEEYKSARSLNKRKRNKLQATVANLKNKLSEDKVSGDGQIASLKAEVGRLRGAISEIASGNGSSSLASAEEAKYRACCRLARDKVASDLREIRRKEQIMFAEYLSNPGGEAALDPAFQLEEALRAIRLPESVIGSGRSSAELTARLLDDSGYSASSGTPEHQFDPGRRRTQLILKSLVVRGDFLVDATLHQVLEKAGPSDDPSQEQQIELAKLDSILQSLGIKSLPQLEKLLFCFETDPSGEQRDDGLDGGLLSHAEVREAVEKFVETSSVKKGDPDIGRPPAASVDGQNLRLEDGADEMTLIAGSDFEAKLHDRHVLWNRAEEYLSRYLSILQQRADCCREMSSASVRNQQLLHILKTYLTPETESSSADGDLDSGLGSVDMRQGAGSLSVQAASFLGN